MVISGYGRSKWLTINGDGKVYGNWLVNNGRF